MSAAKAASRRRVKPIRRDEGSVMCQRISCTDQQHVAGFTRALPIARYNAARPPARRVECQRVVRFYGKLHPSGTMPAGAAAAAAATVVRGNTCLPRKTKKTGRYSCR